MPSSVASSVANRRLYAPRASSSMARNSLNPQSGQEKQNQSESEQETSLPPERYIHGEIIRQDHAMADEDGRPSRPYRTVNILDSMQKSGKISGEMHQAGDDFRSLFDRACFDPLQCPDISRPMVSGRRKLSAVLNGRVEDARLAVYEAVNAVGGYDSHAGNLVINVLGWGWSIKHWSRERSRTKRPIHEQEASGIFQGALGVLEKHFGENLT